MKVWVCASLTSCHCLNCGEGGSSCKSDLLIWHSGQLTSFKLSPPHPHHTPNLQLHFPPPILEDVSVPQSQPEKLWNWIVRICQPVKFSTAGYIDPNWVSSPRLIDGWTNRDVFGISNTFPHTTTRSYHLLQDLNLLRQSCLSDICFFSLLHGFDSHM